MSKNAYVHNLYICHLHFFLVLSNLALKYFLFILILHGKVFNLILYGIKNIFFSMKLFLFCFSCKEMAFVCFVYSVFIFKYLYFCLIFGFFIAQLDSSLGIAITFLKCQFLGKQFPNLYCIFVKHELNGLYSGLKLSPNC